MTQAEMRKLRESMRSLSDAERESIISRLRKPAQFRQ